MHISGLYSIVAIGIASNLDNAGVGIAYGVRRISIPWTRNLVIAVISFFATAAAGLLGSTVTAWLPPRAATWIGTVVIIAVGVWVLMQPFYAKRLQTQAAHGSQPFHDSPDEQEHSGSFITNILRNPEAADRNKNLHISYGEAAILGVALAMNALAGGFDAGITKLDVWWTSVSVGLFSFILLGLAAFAGRRYAADRLGERATIAAGILLILVGIHQMF